MCRLSSEALEGRVARRDLFLGGSMSLSSRPGGYGFSQREVGSSVLSPPSTEKGEILSGSGWRTGRWTVGRASWSLKPPLEWAKPRCSAPDGLAWGLFIPGEAGRSIGWYT